MAKEQGAKPVEEEAVEPRLKVRYNEEVRKALTEKFGYKNTMQVPKLLKITVSMGVSDGTRDVKLLDAAENELGVICGQKPKRTRSTKSISQFKLREGMPIGCFVTLRRNRMYEFMDRLISIAIPRIRDFRGLTPKSFDGRGNFGMGVREHLIFMELDHSKIAKERGLNIVVVTSAKSDEEAFELLRLMGMPFRES